MFLYSGGDSIKSLRFHDEIENMVGKVIPGLLEVILSSSIAEVYRLVLKTVFPTEDQLKNPNTSMKRKLNDCSGEEAREEHVNIKSRGYVTVAAGLISFVALSRGSHMFSVNCSKSFINLSKMRPARTKLRQSPLSSPVISNMMKTEERRSDLTNVSKADEIGPPQGSLGKDNSVPIAKFLIVVRWTSCTGKCVDASPLVIIPATDDLSATVYIGSHSHAMQAIDLDSGKIKWERILEDRIESSACVSKCGSFIVVGTYFNLPIFNPFSLLKFKYF